MKLHICTDLTCPKRPLIEILRRVAGSDASNLSEALRDLAEAIEEAPRAPEGATLAQFSFDETPGKGLDVEKADVAEAVRLGVRQALKLAPGSRVARIAVVMHLVENEGGAR